MRKSVFVHLPKTAGTSLHKALRECLGADAVSPSFVATRMTQAEAQRLDRFTIISGHISIEDVKKYFPDRLVLTVLRDPVDRCLSFYYFARKSTTPSFAPDFAAAKKHSVEDFFALDYRLIYRNVYNRQVRQLGDHVLNIDANIQVALENAKEVLHTAAWVGRQENLTADIEKLKAQFPELASLTIPTLNSTNDRKSANELTEDLIERIRALNKFDIELCDFAASESRAPSI